MILRVKEKTEIHTDKGGAFNNMERLGYSHKTVNHSGEIHDTLLVTWYFVNPKDGTHTNHVEGGVFGQTKQYIAKHPTCNYSPEFLEDHLQYFTWTRNFTAMTHVSVFINSLYCLSQTYPPNKPNLTLNKLKDFSNVYVVEYIMDDSYCIKNLQPIWFVKWYNYSYKHSSWAYGISDYIKNEYNRMKNSVEGREIIRKRLETYTKLSY